MAMLTEKAAIAANRFGLGARPGDAKRIGGDPAGWLEAELDAAARNALALEAAPETARVLQEVRELRLARAVASQARARLQGDAGEARRRTAQDASRSDDGPRQDTPEIDAAAIRDYAAFVRERYLAQAGERYGRAIATDAPFVERLVHFWSNHFAVSADKQPLGAIAGLYEQEAIRPHVTGNFLDLLTAAERHPAMILYLDNQASMGARGAHDQPQPRSGSRPQRESRARDLGAAHARRRRRLHATGRRGIRQGADGLVDRRAARSRRGIRATRRARSRGT
jgi:uncharacterized protein (DUF1800 family)